MSSTQLVYREELTTAGVLGGTVELRDPIELNPNKPKYIRLVQARFSREIPNIYASTDGSFDNTSLQITNDGGSTYTTINLTPGIFSILNLNQAIDNVARGLSWWIANTPAITLAYNTTTTIVYVILDTTALLIGSQIGIKFDNKQLNQSLGFISTATFLTDGAHSASSIPRLEQTSSVDIHCSLVIGSSFINEESTDVLVSVPLTVLSVDANEYVAPLTGNPQPLLNTQISNSIQGFRISFRNGDGLPLSLGQVETNFLYGSGYVSFEIYQTL